MKDERRKRKRVPFIKETIFITSEGHTHYPVVQNVSMNGFLLQTTEPLRLGETGKIKIKLQCGEEQKLLQAECKVVRSLTAGPQNSQGGVGLEISAIDSDSSIILYNIIKYQDKDL